MFACDFHVDSSHMLFGILVVTPDDVTTSRGTSAQSPRDNVIFELGMLVGRLGLHRALMATVRSGAGIKLPSDLLGVSALEIAAGPSDNLSSRVGPAAEEFRRIVRATLGGS